VTLLGADQAASLIKSEASLIVARDDLFKLGAADRQPLPRARSQQSGYLDPAAGHKHELKLLGPMPKVFAEELASLYQPLLVHRGLLPGYTRSANRVAKPNTVCGPDALRQHDGRAARREGDLIGHLVPEMGALISIPAGIKHMPILGQFTIYTIVGGTVWNAGLVILGWALGSNWTLVEQYASLAFLPSAIGVPGAVVFDVGVAWLGFALLTGAGASTEQQASRVR